MFHPLKKISQGHWPLFLMGTMSSIANLFLPIILVRILSPQDIGLYKAFFLYLTVLPFLALTGGPLNSLYYWIGFGKEEGTLYIQNSWPVTMMFSSLILFLGLITLLLPKDLMPISSTNLLLLVISAFLISPCSHYAEVCVAQGKVAIGALLGLIFEVIKVAGFIWLALKFHDVTIIFQFYCLMMVLSFIFMTTLAAYNRALTFRPSLKIMSQITKYSVPISLSSGILFLIDKADLLILSSTLSAENFALYSIGCLSIPPLFLMEMSVQKVLIPKISELYLKKDFLQIQMAFRKAIGDIAYLIIPAIFGLYFFSLPLIDLLYTENYSGSAHYLQIYSLSYVLLLIPHDSVLRATGETKVILKYNLIMLLLGLIVLGISAIHFDPHTTLALAILIKFIPKILGLNYSRKLIHAELVDLVPWRRLAEYCAVSGALTIISFVLKSFFPSETSWILITIPVFALIYLGIFGLWRKSLGFSSDF